VPPPSLMSQGVTRKDIERPLERFGWRVRVPSHSAESGKIRNIFKCLIQSILAQPRCFYILSFGLFLYTGNGTRVRPPLEWNPAPPLVDSRCCVNAPNGSGSPGSIRSGERLVHWLNFSHQRPDRVDLNLPSQPGNELRQRELIKIECFEVADCVNARTCS